MLRSYLFKASWRATSLKFWVDAKNETDAVKKAERTVMCMMGGAYCMDLQLVKAVEETHV